MRDIEKILTENEERKKKLFYEYDPYIGIGSPVPRFRMQIDKERYFYAPNSFMDEPIVDMIMQYGSIKEFYSSTQEEFSEEDFELGLQDIFELRFKHDFEFWAASCGKIKKKKDEGENQSKESMILFKLNHGQLILHKEMERQRLANLPIRAIEVKDRQFGSSTYFTFYGTWLALYHYTNWNMAICAAFDEQARNIRGKITTLAKEYPKHLNKIELRPYEGSNKNKLIVHRECVLGVGSIQNPENLRSFDFDCLICSELRDWVETKQRKPEDMLLGLRAGIANVPGTLIVLESTPKGAGGLFHAEYTAAKKGESGYAPLYVPWFIHKNHTKEIDDYNAFINKMSEYDWFMWGEGATLEGIKWYNQKKKGERFSDKMMKSEYSTNDVEAFQFGTDLVFNTEDIEKNRQFCKKPEAKGELRAIGITGHDALIGIEFEDNPLGNLVVWQYPDKDLKMMHRYSTVMDIGGRREKADKTVITVMDRYHMMYGGKPEKVARWRGNIDLDRAAWKAIQIAEWYNKSLFTPEMNVLSTKENRKTDGDGFLTVIDEIYPYYSNVFMRVTIDKVKKESLERIGFWMTPPMKAKIVNDLIKGYRDMTYFEFDEEALNEAQNFEYKEDGTMGAIEGEHDDNLISTGINLWVCTNYLPLPYLIQNTPAFEEKIVGDGMANF